MRDLLVVAGVIVVLVLLLAVFVEPAQTGRMRFLAPLGMTGWGGISGTFETRQVEPGHSSLGMTGWGGTSGTSETRQVEPGHSSLGMTGWGGTSGTSETRQAEPGHSPSGPAGHAGRAEDAVQRENPAFVCLALVGGTALLAGLVWMGKLRMSTSGDASAKRGGKPLSRAG